MPIGDAELAERVEEEAAVKAEEEATESTDTVARDFDVTDRAVMDRLSRVIGALGIDAVQAQIRSSVLVSGLGGLGIEIAKNIVLSGVKSLTVNDECVVTMHDLASQFFVRETDIAKNRAAASASRLQELNLYVRVKHTEESLSQADLSFLAEFSVVILTDALSLDIVRVVDAYCRSKGVHFIYANLLGVFGWTFVDFGSKFVVSDATGEEARGGVITSSQSVSGSILTLIECAKRHDLDDGDVVVLSGGAEAGGTGGLPPRHATVKVIDQLRFEVDGGEEEDDLAAGGRVNTFTQVKLPVTIAHDSFESSFSNPQFDELMHADFSKMEHPTAAFYAMRAIDLFGKRSSSEASGAEPGSGDEPGGRGLSRLPRPWNDDDASKVVELAQECHKSDYALNDPGGEKPYEELGSKCLDLIRLASNTSAGYFAPLAAYLGGVVAQEALKAISGKFMPIRQWCFVDATEVVPCELGSRLTDHQSCTQPKTPYRSDALQIILGATLLQVL